MTLQEYVISLQNQNLSQEEIYAKVEEFKKKNPQPQVEEEVEEVVEEKPIKLTIESATEPIEPEIDVDEFDFKTAQNNINKLEADLIQLSGGDMEMDAMDTPNRIKMYNNTLTELNKAVEDYNTVLTKIQDKEQKERNKIAEKSYLEKVFTVDLAKSSTMLGEMMFGFGEFMYDVFAWPQNQLVDVGVLNKKFRIGEKGQRPSDVLKEDLGIKNTLLDFYEKETEELSKEQTIWNNENYDVQGVTNNFKKGNYIDGFKQLGSGIAESSGVSIAMLLSGIGGMSRIQMAKRYTPVFAGKEYKELKKENPDTNDGILIAQALGLGAAETVFESIGSGTIGRVYKDILLKEGKEEGVKVFRNGLIEMYEQALKKAGAPAGALGEGIEEVATQITQNMIKGKDPFEGVSDAFLQGVGGGATYAGPINIMQVTSGLKEAVAINKINKSLAKVNPNFNVNNITEVYSTPVDLSKPVSGLEELKIAQIPKAKTILDQQVTKDLELGKINQEQADNIQENFRNITQASQQLKPLGLNENVEAASLLIEKNKLQQKIKQVNDSALTQKDTNRVNEINSRLGEIVVEEKAAFEQEKSQTVGMSVLPTRRTDETVEETDIEIDDSADGINETLLETIKDPNASKADQNQAQQALIDNNQNLYLEAVRFSTEAGTIPRSRVLEAINSKLGPIINNFDPAKGVTWSTYVTNSLKPKMQEIYAEASIGQRGVSLDVEGARQVADTQVETDTRQEIPQRPKVYPSQLEVVAEKLTPEVRETQNTKVKDEIIRSINDKGVSPDVVAKDIISKTQEKEIRGVIKGAIGRFGSPEYNQFVDDVVNQDFINSLPLSTIKGRFGKLFGIEEISRVPTRNVREGKKDSNFKKQVFRIPKTTPETIQKVKDYFKRNEKRSQSLFSILAEGAVVEEVQAMKGDTDFMNKLNDVLELKGSDLNAEQFMDQFQKDADQRIKEDTSFDIVEDVIDDMISDLDGYVERMKGTFGSNNILPAAATAVKAGLKVFKTVYQKTKSIAKAINAAVNEIYSKLGNILSKKEIKEIVEPEFTKEKIEGNAVDIEYLIQQISDATGFKRDKAYEQLVIDNAIELSKKFPGLKVILKKPSEKGRYRNFDFAFELNGIEFLGESKLENAQYSSVNGTYDFNTNKFKFTKDYYSSELQAEMDKLVNKNKPNLKAWAKGIKDQGVDLTTSSKKIPLSAWDNNQEAGLQKPTTVKQTMDASIVSELYNKKQPPVYYINIKGQGLFYMGQNPLGLDIPALQGSVDMVFRFKRSKTDDNGNITPTLAFVPANLKSNVKSKYDLGNPASFGKLMESPVVKNLLKSENVARTNTANIASDIITTKQSPSEVKQTLVNSQDVRVEAQKTSKKTKGLSAFDFDDTLALTKEKVLYTMPDGTTGELTSGEFAVQAEELTAQGAEFDFTNFENVDVSTLEGPMVDEARKKQKKFGPKDIFVVTARPGASVEAIQTFLKGIGLNIPLKNITALGNGDPQAKADWFLDKAKDGYNDFYFSDDSLLNVQQVKNVLDQIDVNSDVQQAIIEKPKTLDKQWNQQIEEVTGRKAGETVSAVRARLEGKKKDGGLFRRFINQFTITPSAADFLGLLYDVAGKGRQGDKHLKFIKDNLIDPYNKAEQTLLSAKTTVAADLAAIKKAFPSLKSKKNVLGINRNPLNEQIGVGPYTKSHAVRVWLWNKQGMDIPGIDQKDINDLVEAVENDLELLPFAENVLLVQKSGQYPAPTNGWAGGTIASDILRGLDTTYRSQLLTEWQENVDIIFSDKNMNKLEAVYGSKWVEAMRDSLRRMKTGSNRPVFVGSGARQVNEMLDWLNASVGNVMFLNMRSGLLQLISNVNFINWGDNNIYNAAKAFTSKEYVPTVLKLMNSDYLVNRRDGLKINVSEAELTEAANKDGLQGMISYLLDKGFVITRIMDSLAIATGGATFYINRVNSLQNRINPKTDKKYTKAEAEEQAFDDFYAIAEETQQSSNPSKISTQQASYGGRILLAFQNVTMQYNRKTKKAIQDLYNRRTKPGMTQKESDLSNMSNILYYVGVQNLIFNGLQQALFAVAFDDEEEDDRTKADRTARIANGMLDSLLNGLGFGGVLVSTVKNVGMRVLSEMEKKSPKYIDAVDEVFNVSPVVDAKIRKLKSGAKTFEWNMSDIRKRGWSLENPAYLAVAQFVSAATNIPVDRVLRKMMNVAQAFDEETSTWQRIALIMGWSGWNLNLPYWGRESTIKKEEQEQEKLKEKHKKDVAKVKSLGFTKKIPLSGPNHYIPEGQSGVDFMQVERPDGTIQYYIKPKK